MNCISQLSPLPRAIQAFLAALLIPFTLSAADGDLDSSFGISGKNSVSLGASDLVYGACRQADGKIIVVGGARPGSSEDFGVARFNANGSLDTAFAVGGIFTLEIIATKTDRATSVGMQSDGKIIVGGYTRTSTVGDNFAIIRLTTAGILDTTFGAGGVVQVDIAGKTDRANALQVLSDDRIVLGGLTSYDSVNLNFGIIRLLPNGALDTTFGTGGKTQVDVGNSQDTMTALLVQPDGKIVFGGNSANSGGNFELSLVRLNADGSTDSTFGSSGTVHFNLPGSAADYINGIALQPDGKILACGYSGGVNAFVARFTASGTLDGTFNTTGYSILDFGGSADQLLAITMLPNSKIVSGGTYINGSYLDSVVVRLNSSGALDGSFGTAGVKKISFGAANDQIRWISALPNGKFVVAVQTADATSADDFGVAQFDAVGAAITSVTAPANGLYGIGRALDFTVTFSQNITINTAGGMPSLSVMIGAASRPAFFNSALDSKTLRFRCYIQPGDVDADGISLIGALALNGGTILDASLNMASLTFAPPSTGIRVDGVAPQVVSIKRQPQAPQLLPANTAAFDVTFSEDVIGLAPGSFAVAPVGNSTVSGYVSAISGGPQVYQATVTVTGGHGEFGLKLIQTASE